MSKRSGYFLLVCSFCAFITASAQRLKIDSLRTVLQTAKQDTNRIITLNLLTRQLINTANFDSALACAQEAVRLSDVLIKNSTKDAETKTAKNGSAIGYTNIGIVNFNLGNYDVALKNYHTAMSIRESTGDKNGIAISYNNIANVFSTRGNYPEALKNQEMVLKLREEIRKVNPDDQFNIKGLAASNSNIGSIYWSQGTYPEALRFYLQALKLFEGINDRASTANCYDGIGIVYYSQHNYDEALKNQFAALKIKKENGDKNGLASTYNNIGGVYEEQGKPDEALKNYMLALQIRQETGAKRGMAGCYSNIGGIYARRGNLDEALKNMSASLEILQEIGDQQGIAQAYNDIGNAYVKHIPLQAADLVNAIAYFNKGLPIAITVGSKEDIKTSYFGLSEAYEKKAQTGNATAATWEMAHYNYKKYIEYRDSIENEENTQKTVQAQMNYEFEKKQALEHTEQVKKDTIAFEEKRKQNIVTVCIAAGLLLVLVFAVFILRSLKTTKSQKAIIEAQKEFVEEKQKEILDSIHYAKRIQVSLLPPEAYIEKSLKRLKKTK